MRLAAVADVHFGLRSTGSMREAFEELAERADVLLIAGDVTRHGDPCEAEVFAHELAAARVAKVAVLGNHDYHQDAQDSIREILEEAAVTVLEGEATTIEVGSDRIAIAGTKGFGGGFAGACGSAFGEPEMKAFVRHTKEISARLEDALASVDGSVRIALLHYSPVEATLIGERLEIYPFLGSYLLGEAIDRVGADLVVHGHAHAGSERGVTASGIMVRNVAMSVINRPYELLSFND
ncbi:MAG TPA: metallophosphoesterase, partial [Actinomycetota bacterium]|nr:metallophosphoesterase [Actinomycetota bacterium]